MENGIAQAILQEIQQFRPHFERIEEKIARVDDRVAKLDDRVGKLDDSVGKLDDRLAKLDDRVGKLDDRVANLETRVAGIESEMSRFGARLSSLEKRMATIEEAVAGLNIEIRTWPDIRYLTVSAKMQLENDRQTKLEIIDIKARLGKIFQSMATDPEIRVLREDIARTRDYNAEVDLRLGVIEARLGLTASVKTH